MDSNEALNAELPQEEKKEIVCKNCLHALPPVQIWGALHERYSFNSCAAFENKPDGILNNGDKCPLFKIREEK
ncbi:MAG: hypothetical protein IJP33_04050 [Firmicutes bacterium]|nr:hypothetical protein [Bacillota bacterium]